MNKHQRRAARRRAVSREERVAPPPEALQHFRAWRLQELLVIGPEHGGIDNDEFEAGLKIATAFKIVTHKVDFKVARFDRQSPSDEFLTEAAERLHRLYVRWGNEVAHRYGVSPTWVYAVIVDEQSATGDRIIALLRRCLRLWSTIADLDAREIDACQPPTNHA